MLHMTAMGTLVAVFALAVSHKLRDYARFEASLGAYRLLPERLVPVVAPLVVLLELGAIAAILAPVGPGAMPAGALLLAYSLALGVNLARGNTSIDCGCGDAPTPISGWLLLRNGVLLLLALVPAPADGVPVAALHWLLAGTLIVLLAVLYLIAEQLLANHHLLRSESSG